MPRNGVSAPKAEECVFLTGSAFRLFTAQRFQCFFHQPAAHLPFLLRVEIRVPQYVHDAVSEYEPIGADHFRDG